MSALQPFLPQLCLLLLVCILVQFAMMANLTRRFAAQTKMLRQFFNGPNDEDLQGLLERILEQSQEAKANSQLALAKIQEASLKNGDSLQHFALIRYDAFEDVTGQQSFSVALLDGRHNGAVVSAIFGRSNSRCFGKSISGGVPDQPLTEEEQQALLRALERKTQNQVARNGHAKREEMVV